MDDRQEDTRLRDLMVAYQGGSYDAFEALYAELASRVRGLLNRHTRDRTRAEDLTQETFLQLHRARHTYDPAYPVLPWVMAIARHVHLMDRRTASRRPSYVAEGEAPEPSIGAEVDRHIEGAPVREALRHVKRERRHALLLHHLGGWSFREIGSKLRIGESAAKLRSSRGIGQLRNALRRDRDDD